MVANRRAVASRKATSAGPLILGAVAPTRTWSPQLCSFVTGLLAGGLCVILWALC